MEILGVELSSNAAEQVQKLCDSFTKRVKYIYSDDNVNEGVSTDDADGSDDTDGKGRYTVYLPSNLDRRTFEANILYELFHIRQFEAGFPTLCNKDSILFDRASDLVNGLGSSIFFGVLDLDVFERMRECRYIDAVYRFVESIFESLVAYASNFFGDLDDKYNFAQLVLDLSKLLYHDNAEYDRQIRESYRDFPRVLEQSFALRDMMRKNPPATPESAAVTMGKLIDALELWDLFYIKLNDDKIRTSAEFAAFCE